jgi:uncharacterized protein YjbI with pentapeptide repeats
MAVQRDAERDWREQEYSSDQLRTISQLGGGVVLLLIGVYIGARLFSGENPVIQDEFWTNVFTEGLGVAVTVLVINRLAARREIRRLKDRLVHEASSQSNERAKAAIDDLRHYGWLTGEDGLLKGADLERANLAGALLEDATLTGADLEDATLTGALLSEANLAGIAFPGANLTSASLRGATLTGANLSRATLTGANLSRATLTGTNLQFARLTNTFLREANLTGTDLRGANLTGAHLGFANLTDANLAIMKLTDAELIRTTLTGANLSRANLIGADLTDAIFDKNTTMPNGEKWHAGMDLAMFTDPEHPDYYTPPV